MPIKSSTLLVRASTGSPCRAFFHPGGPSDRTCRWSSGRGLFRSLKIGQSGWREGCGFPSCSEPTSQHPLSATFEDLQKITIQYRLVFTHSVMFGDKILWQLYHKVKVKSDIPSGKCSCPALETNFLSL